MSTAKKYFIIGIIVAVCIAIITIGVTFVVGLSGHTSTNTTQQQTQTQQGNGSQQQDQVIINK